MCTLVYLLALTAVSTPALAETPNDFLAAFVQAEAAGSGLGLSVAARIAQLHHAQLELTETDEGRGLRVAVGFEAAGAKA